MLTKTVRLEFGKRERTKKFIITGDWHIGVPACHHPGIKRLIGRCATAPWIHLADIMEAIIPGDRRFEIDQHGELNLLGQWAKASQYVREAKDTCLGLLSGNHEGTLSRVLGSLSKVVAQDAGVDYLTQTTYVRFVCPDGELVGFFAHGRLTFTGRAGDEERRDLNNQLRLRDYLREFGAKLGENCFKAIGHGHIGVITPRVSKYKMVMRGGDVKRVPCAIKEDWLMMCPAMYRIYGDKESYAEARLYRPTDIGWLEVEITRDGRIDLVRQVKEDGSIVREVREKLIC